MLGPVPRLTTYAQLSCLRALYLSGTGLEHLPAGGLFLNQLRLISLDAAALPGCLDALAHAPHLRTLFVDTTTRADLACEDAARVLAALTSTTPSLRRIVFVSDPSRERALSVGLMTLMLRVGRCCPPRIEVLALAEEEFFAVELAAIDEDPDAWV